MIIYVTKTYDDQGKCRIVAVSEYDDIVAVSSAFDKNNRDEYLGYMMQIYTKVEDSGAIIIPWNEARRSYYSL